MGATGEGLNYTVLLGEDDRILRASPKFCELLGISENLSSLSWQDLVLEDACKFRPAGTGESLRFSGYLKKQSGEILDASFNCECIENLDKVVLVEIALHGSEKSSAGPVGVADRDSLDFLTTVSHELRVALNGVIGFANVLGGTRLDVEQLAALEKLQACNNMLKGLINDILEYSRVANAKLDFHMETVQLDSLVSDVVSLFKERANKKGLELKFVAGKGTAIRTSLAKMRVTQVISNLIGNAIKFTEHGWVSVSVAIAERRICIEVQDTGPGISESEGESIFRPFFQSAERDRHNEGSGLGLSISRELVEKMGGRLILRHPDEGGCLFEVNLPLKLADAERKAEPSIQSSSSEERGEPQRAKEAELSSVKRILVVEDNQLNADILGHFLQDYGVEFDHVDNGKTAVETFEDGRYDLILMDVMLPEMNGYEATEKILSRSGRKKPVPIIGVTAKVFRRDQVRCIEAGMVEVVHKPVDFKQLREVLDFHLYAKSPSRDEELEVPMFVDEDIETLEQRESESSETLAPSTRGGLDPTTLEAYIDRMKSSNSDRSDIVKTAVGIVDGEISRLLESIEGGERKEIGMRAHSLKGALALLGARNILDLAKGLELIATDGKTPLKAEHWGMLINDAYTDFKYELNVYMADTGSAIE